MLNQNFFGRLAAPNGLLTLPTPILEGSSNNCPLHGFENSAAAAEKSSCCHLRRMSSVISIEPIHTRRTESILINDASARSWSSLHLPEETACGSGNCL